MVRRFWVRLLAVMAVLHMVPSAGYGKRTFVQGLALLCKHLYRYITRHQPALQANLPEPIYTCVTGLLPCLLSILEYLNKSAP